jgi:hypothetical protein
MLTTTLFPGRYTQGPDALKDLGDGIKRLTLFTVVPVTADAVSNAIKIADQYEKKFN